MSNRNVNNKRVVENLREVIRDLGKNPNTFAKMVGIDPSNFQKKLKGQVSFTSKDFIKLGKSHINVDYLLTGEGNLYTGEVDRGTLPISAEKAIPVYGEEFSCGFLSFDDTAIRPMGYVDFPGTRGATCWCKATGDSMQPLISNGDYVCLKKLSDWNDFLVYGDIYAVETTNDMRTIKKIERGNTNEEYTLVPVNSEYEPQPVRKDMIRSMFRVLASTKIL